MKFDCGLTRAERLDRRAERKFERNQRLREWHLWFAWRPVRVGHRDCRWLEWVERQGYRHSRWSTFREEHMMTWTWSYRAYQEPVETGPFAGRGVQKAPV